MFAAAVCVQVMCWAFGPAEKLPPAVAEAGATSSTCVRALSALAGVCRRFQTGAGAHRRSGAHFGMFAAAVCVQVVCWVFDRAEKLPPAVAEVGATSGLCLRALSALAGVCHRVQTRGSVRG